MTAVSFQMMLRKMNEGNPEKELMDVFMVFDKDGSGTISGDELRQAMKVCSEVYCCPLDPVGCTLCMALTLLCLLACR